MSALDEAEKLRLERVVPELEKAVHAGLGGQTMAGILAGLKGRLTELTEQLGFVGDEKKERKDRAALAEMAAGHVAFRSRLSKQAQNQFDGFLSAGFRNKRDLEELSVFLSQNGRDLNFLQRIQVVDEVLDGVERRD